ncbi:MAG: LLM class flavin-dependent oxidoreductase [Actinomycetota bacterium]
MKIGMYLPHWDTAMDGEAPTWANIVATAQAAEAIGLDSVWVIDHYNIRFTEDSAWALWDPWSVLAGVAASTSRIELGPLVSCTAYRNPALLAKAAAAVDGISDGRLILGLGGGYFDAEFRALGIPADHRVDRFSEAVDVVTRLLRDGTVDHHGEHYQIRDFSMGIPPVRPSGPPILIGATKPRMMRLTARYADLWNGWFPFSIDPIDDYRTMRRELDEVCVEEGRDPHTLGRTATVAAALLGRTLTYGPHEMSLVGREPGEIAEALHALEVEGVDHVQLCLAPATPEGVEAFAPVLEALGRARQRAAVRE